MLFAPVKIINSQGMHMNTAKMIVQAVKPFPGCKVTLRFGGKDIAAKNAVFIMAAGMKQGAELEIHADGEGEAEALAAVKKLFDDGFGE
ncbi:MAG: HPr family phosphocarrier protein [Deltaproteobacteria bacterium]|jgi:phosphotransferase system HPr (HPr) family protein|nr:HPr family phosphocarrier protein [Deltaproteobacteria bacterium]